MNTVNSVNVPPPFAGSSQPQHPSEGRAIRAWRVGSLSMGITLILMGTAFAVSLWQETEAYELLLWVAPVVFMLLGTELLLYLKMSGNRDTVVRYDWVSVFFVGLIGAASLALALLISTGVFDELREGMGTVQRTAYVDTERVGVPDEVTKVVVQATDGVTLSETDTREAHLMGQIRYWSKEPISAIDADIMRTEIVGNTMYIVIGSVAHRDGGLVTDAVRPMLILALPKGLQAEVQGY
ncbi:hypothetical protein RB620_12045 [Paenibacillus sp. LHD-117]|uniref:hypothetical protein n=1 Tax=Paenibacillus sp. LHD-117 TaxID=3071412 RepID=UPI0027DF1003|nr:hypothetical protein [Paenibacillus sp. LHD-117]MDQ6420170.1 hypothetical protein [Paenibacillus sp. LHD-117]